VDFESETLENGLRQAGFDAGKCTFFSWLGVTPYLTNSAVIATLRFVASMPVGGGIVFDYMILPSSLDPAARLAFVWSPPPKEFIKSSGTGKSASLVKLESFFPAPDDRCRHVPFTGIRSFHLGISTIDPTFLLYVSEGRPVIPVCE